jgi:hypothetical protein
MMSLSSEYLEVYMMSLISVYLEVYDELEQCDDELEQCVPGSL